MQISHFILLYTEEGWLETAAAVLCSTLAFEKIGSEENIVCLQSMYK